jgi:hypothetical protein
MSTTPRGAQLHSTLSVETTLQFEAELICREIVLLFMSHEESEDEGAFVDCEVVHDNIGVTRFLPPRRCKNCDD